MGLTVSATPSSLAGSVALWALLYTIAARVFRLPARQAATGSLAAVALHWASVVAHHAGHAAAARTTGHPMTGVRLWGLLGSSLYPADEPALPAATHARRALGGPAASVALGGVLVPLWLLQAPTGLGGMRPPTAVGWKVRRLRSGLDGRGRQLGDDSSLPALGTAAPLSPIRPQSEAVAGPPSQSETVRLLSTFAILDNVVVLGLGSLLPLGFTDGSTLLRLWRERARSRSNGK